MSTSGPNSTRTMSTAQHRPFSHWGLAFQIFPGVGLVATVVVMLIASEPWRGQVAITDLVSEGGFILWGILPFLGLSALVIMTDRLARSRLWVLAVGGSALLAYTAWSLVGFFQSDSSTSALIFLFLPVIQWAAVVATGVVVLVITVLRSARKRH